MWENQTCRYQDIIGPEPILGPYTDIHRWDAWNKWFKGFCNVPCWSNGVIRDGLLIYTTILRSSGKRRAEDRKRDLSWRAHKKYRLMRVRCELRFKRNGGTSRPWFLHRRTA